MLTVLLELAIIIFAFAVPMTMLPFVILAERKTAAWFQHRMGPNRVGPWGILQSVADVFKLLFKEDMRPSQVDGWLWTIAPIVTFVFVMAGFVIIPFGPGWMVDGEHVALQAASLNIGLLFLFAMSSLAAYGLAFGGWASRNKFSQMGGVRATAQMVSYELTLGLVFIAVIMAASDPVKGISGLTISDIVWDQMRVAGDAGYEAKTFLGFLPGWNMFYQPLAFILFVIAAFAETNRTPFDLPEAEPELVGGFHTEYSAFKFGMFFMGEFCGVMLMSALITLLFLGGWDGPFMPLEPTTFWASVLGFGYFMVKWVFCIFFFMWVRWSLPRFRYDQLMDLGWKVMIELATLNVILTALMTL